MGKGGFVCQSHAHGFAPAKAGKGRVGYADLTRQRPKLASPRHLAKAHRAAVHHGTGHATHGSALLRHLKPPGAVDPPHIHVRLRRQGGRCVAPIGRGHASG